MRVREGLLSIAVGLASAPAGLAQVPVGRSPAAPRQCILQYRGDAPTNSIKDTVATRTQGKDVYNVYVGRGATYFCEGQGNQLTADSTEYYGTTSMLVLIGNVHYTEPRAKVDSDRMVYYRLEDRLVADGNVNALMSNGTTMQGPHAEYFRQVPGVRPLARLVATGRPRMSLVQSDSSARSSEPTHVVANTVVSDGDSLVYASGRVEVDRTDISARGDSAFLDSGREFARLMRTPSLTSKGERPFTLRGTVIDVFSHQRQLQRVLSMRNADATSQDIRLRSDTLDLRVSANQLDRAFAWGGSGARVTSPERDILADSLDVMLAHQRLREVHALRHGYAESDPDTTRFRSKERDWIRGDTLVARFDTVAASDTSRRPHVREVVALGNASALYQLAPQKPDSLDRPAINYVRGREITLDFADQQVRMVTVLDKAVGVYLEPGESAQPGSRGRAALPTGRVPTGSGRPGGHE